LDEQTKTAIGFFNYAHSYCKSAIALHEADVKATHPDGPVYYLFYHSIELYLKSYLLANGISSDDLAKRFGHRTRKLANKAKEFGLVLTEVDELVVTQMAKSDNVISSRYLRLGTHQLLPIVVYHETCFRLHEAIGPVAYEASGVARRPILQPPKINSLIGHNSRS